MNPIATRLRASLPSHPLLAAVVASLGIMLSTGAWAQAEPPTSCTSDADCGEGEICELMPCAMPDCDPDDPECEPPPPCDSSGFCQAEGSGGGWTSECEQDSDCGQGYVCEVVGGTSCACPAGQSCPECDEPTEIKGCVPAPCTAASDCGDGLICITVEYEACEPQATAPCAEGQECAPPPEPSCDTVSESFCGPPYVAPCETASDCGDGFTCEAAEVCVCEGTTDSTDAGAPPSSGSSSDGSSGGSSGGAPASDEEQQEEDNCTCSPTGQNQCVLIETVCTGDEQCPEGWSCQAEPSPAISCVEIPGEDIDCPEPEPATSLCVPPNWGSWGAEAGSFSDAIDNATGAENSSVQTPTADERGALAPVTDASDSCASGQGVGFGGLAMILMALVWVRRRALGLAGA